jgi:protease II
MDDNSEYEDWIELYNNNSNSISLNGLYLSDELEHLMKWPLPNQTLNPDSYIVIWADSDEGPLHANFKLSSLGEQLYLTDQNGLVLDSVIFEQQIEDVSYGRIPNGQGEFMLITPTLASTNDQSKLIPNSSELLVDLYPNPANHTLNLKLESQLEVEMYLFDMKGEILLQTTIERGISDLEIPITHLSNGIYALSLRTKERLYNKKIVKL